MTKLAIVFRSFVNTPNTRTALRSDILQSDSLQSDTHLFAFEFHSTLPETSETLRPAGLQSERSDRVWRCVASKRRLNRNRTKGTKFWNWKHMGSLHVNSKFLSGSAITVLTELSEPSLSQRRLSWRVTAGFRSKGYTRI